MAETMTREEDRELMAEFFESVRFEGDDEAPEDEIPDLPDDAWPDDD